MIIGITGLSYDSDDRRSIAGSGKDTIAEQLVKKHQFVSVALADPMKRFCQEIFDFTDDQLWSVSEKRNEPDKRYKRPLSEWNEAVVKGLQVPRELVLTPEMTYLTPRYALQRLGTEWARDCYQDVWVNYCLKQCSVLLEEDGWMYRKAEGVVSQWDTTSEGEWKRDDAPDGRYKGVVIPDLRFVNEFKRIKEAGGKVWRVKRRVACVPKELGEGHLSERELLELPDSEFDAIFPNEGSIHHLHLLVDAVMARESGRILDYDEVAEDIPPFKRKP
jgi:hypothetical protein